MPFKKYSRYYDLLYRDKNYFLEVDYVDNLIRQFSKRATNSILDLGCGTGIHGHLLSDKGYYVHGVDRSEDMIEIARKKERSSLKFSCGDITTIELNRKFDAVISLFHVFSYVTTNEGIRALLTNVSRHLNDDGLFIFDCWYGPAVLTEKPEARLKKIEDDDSVIYRFANPQIHPNDNTVDVGYEIIIEGNQGQEYEHFSEIHPMRYFFKPEIEVFLSSSGFTLLHCEEWMTKRQPGFNTWGVCWIAQKHH